MDRKRMTTRVKPQVQTKICDACLKEARRHTRVARFFPRWACRGCGAICCEHRCSFKEGHAASCGNCQIARTRVKPGGARP